MMNLNQNKAHDAHYTVSHCRFTDYKSFCNNVSMTMQDVCHYSNNLFSNAQYYMNCVLLHCYLSQISG